MTREKQLFESYKHQLFQWAETVLTSNILLQSTYSHFYAHTLGMSEL